MEYFIALCTVQAQFFFYLVVGYVCRKMHLISDEGKKTLSNLLLYAFLPCMILLSFHGSITFEQMTAAALLLLIAFVVSGFSFALGQVLYRRVPGEQRTIMRYGTLIANSGFIGLPLVAAAYGTQGLFYASIFLIPTRIFMWSAGISMFVEKDRRTRIRNVLLNPGILAVVAGIPLMLLQIRLPALLSVAIETLGDCTTPVSMIVVGAILADVPLKSIPDKNVFYISFVRLIAIPLVVLLILRALGLDTLSIAVAVILSGAPVGSTTAVLADQYGADAKFASKCVFVSTLLSLITIPLISLLF